MSPSTKPERVLKVRVPRHNSQRIGPVLTSHVETVAHNERTRVDVRQTALEPTSALAQAIVSTTPYVEVKTAGLNRFGLQESASDWNSLLLTARAARGPQWDVGTQQYVPKVCFIAS